MLNKWKLHHKFCLPVLHQQMDLNRLDFLRYHDNEMICLADNNEDYYTIALEDVGGKEKKVPDDFYDAKNKQMTKDFKEWIMPIIGNFDDKYLSLSDMK